MGRRHKRAGQRPVSWPPVGDITSLHYAETLASFTRKNAWPATACPARLQQDVEHVAVLVETRRPQVMVVPLIFHAHLVEVHLSPGAGSPPRNRAAYVPPEPRTPEPIVSWVPTTTAGQHQLLNVAHSARNGRQPHLCPMRPRSDTVALVPSPQSPQHQSSQPPNKSNNLTMPPPHQAPTTARNTTTARR